MINNLKIMKNQKMIDNLKMMIKPKTSQSHRTANNLNKTINKKMKQRKITNKIKTKTKKIKSHLV